MDYLLFLEYIDNILNLQLTLYLLAIIILLTKGVVTIWQLFTK